MKIYFYPYAYLRDRQLDTIRRWTSGEVVSPEVADKRRGGQVSAAYAKASTLRWSWKSRLPLINVKFRPREAPKDAVIYVWGAVVATGSFIVDLDNPWSLTGYNLRAMALHRPILRYILASSRCREIRCISEACRLSLKAIFGQAVYDKASVHYPCIPQVVCRMDSVIPDSCRFLFVGTQFEIKGGEALLKAFRRVYERVPSARLDVITHLPAKCSDLAKSCAGIHVHEARFSRDEIHAQFMSQADVVVLPTYVESFGMVALEGLAHGLALIATDVYALREMVEDGKNGRLLTPPISIWDGVLPSRNYYDLEHIKEHIGKTDTTVFEGRLEKAMYELAANPELRLAARQASVRIMKVRFSC